MKQNKTHYYNQEAPQEQNFQLQSLASITTMMRMQRMMRMI